jgi:hypothetical protein
MELTLAERRSPWSRQYAGKPIEITLLPLPDFASSMSFPVIRPSEIIFSPTMQHSLNKPSNSYTYHEQHSLVQISSGKREISKGTTLIYETQNIMTNTSSDFNSTILFFIEDEREGALRNELGLETETEPEVFIDESIFFRY